MDVARFKNLQTLAAILWLASLALPALVAEDGDSAHGWQILLSGWLGPLSLSFAWYANVLFLVGLNRAFSGRSVPAWMALGAVVLALDTIRLKQLASTELPVLIAGYSWGAVLWFFAMFVLLILSGAQAEGRRSGSLLSLAGVALCVLTAIAVPALAAHDRFALNPWKSMWLELGFGCDSPEPMISQPMRDFAGPLEVVLSPTSDDHMLDQYGRVETLLSWGVPIVRVGGFDHSIARTTDGGEVLAVPARDRPAAAMYVSLVADESISIKLVDEREARTILDHTWRRQVLPNGERYYCPKYEEAASPEQPPRAVLMEALGIQAREWQRSSAGEFPRVNAVVLDRTDDPAITTEKSWAETLRGPDSASMMRARSANGCPAGVELVASQGFRVNDRTVYLSSSPDHVLCQGSEAYLFASKDRHGEEVLRIDARDLRDLRRKWSAILVLPRAEGSLTLALRNVAVSERTLTVTAVDEEHGQVLRIRAALPDR